MKTYLITGGAGFIGSNFIMYMLNNHTDIKLINFDALTYAGNLENLRQVENDPRYVFIKGDICDKKAVDAVFKEYMVDVVVNMAAESHVDRSIATPEIFVYTNVLGTLNLLHTARRYWEMDEGIYRDSVKFLQVSTDEVYGSLGAEGFFVETTPLSPNSPYSASKASADLLVRAWNETFHLPTNITRCSNNYGPYQFPEKLIPLMINNLFAHKSLPVYGDGLQIRDWLYVEDHCKAIDMVIDKGRIGEVYNVGGHNEKTNLYIVNILIEYFHEHIDKEVTKDLVQHVTDRKGHDRRYAIDPAKISRELGWQPETVFEEGIEKTIQWFISNRDWIESVTSGAYQQYYRQMYESDV